MTKAKKFWAIRIDQWGWPGYVQGHKGETREHLGLETLYSSSRPSVEVQKQLLKNAEENPLVESVQITIFHNHERKYKKLFRKGR